MEFVRILCEELSKESLIPKDFDVDAHIELVEMQPGDVVVTCADTKALESGFGYRPNTSFKMGICQFARWYRDYYGIQEEK